MKKGRLLNMNSLSKILLFIMVFSFSAIFPQQQGKLDTLVKSDSLLSNFKPQLVKPFKPEIYLNEYDQKKENFTSSYLFKGLITGVVALGATAAYFKIKADERFDQYNLTKDKTYLDETRKFDWISGISFSALQINLGFLIYYFLIE